MKKNKLKKRKGKKKEKRIEREIVLESLRRNSAITMMLKGINIEPN